jgi:hypothetical protein
VGKVMTADQGESPPRIEYHATEFGISEWHGNVFFEIPGTEDGLTVERGEIMKKTDPLAEGMSRRDMLKASGVALGGFFDVVCAQI